MGTCSVLTLLPEPSKAVITRFGDLGHGAASLPGMEGLIDDLARALCAGECDESAHGECAATCMDDRLRVDGTDPLLPNIAGGSFGLLLAARAVYPAYDPQILSTRWFMGILKDNGFPLYAHIDQQFQEGGLTGCAFNDRMGEIGANLPQIVNEAMTLFGVGEGCATWATASEVAHRIQTITTVSPHTGKDPYGEDSFSRLAAVREVHGTTEVLQGLHRPLGADISFHRGHTLSRTPLDVDHAVKIFHLDAWSFQATATRLVAILPRSWAQSEVSHDDLIQQMSLTMLLTGLSAMSLLCAPEMFLVIRP